GLDLADVVVNTLDLEAEGGREVLLVADHHVDVLRDLAIDLLCLLEAADALPERRPVVEIVGHDRAVLVGGLDRLDRERGRRLGQRREDAASVEPACTEFAEDVIPVEITGLQLRRGRVAAVRNANCTTDAETAFGEVEAIADRAADAIILAPLDEVGCDAALHDEVLDEVSDFVVDKGGADGGLQAEALAEAARGVVFTTAFPED